MKFRDRCVAVCKTLGPVTDHGFVEEFKVYLKGYQSGRKYNNGLIKGLYVDVNQFGTNTLYIEYPDRPHESISYNKLCKGVNKDTRLDDFKHCARCEIADQIMDYKKSNPPSVNEHTDHYGTSFIQLLYDFHILEELTTYPSIEHVPGGIEYFSDRSFARRWKEYHGKHATLRNIDRIENTRLGITERKKKLKFNLPHGGRGSL